MHIFEFAPAIDEYLKTHLFGDIFERDNLDWQSRELATVSMLSVLSGTEPQLQAHMRISMDVGLTAGQLHQVGKVLTKRVDADSGRRVQEALLQHLATLPIEKNSSASCAKCKSMVDGSGTFTPTIDAAALKLGSVMINPTPPRARARWYSMSLSVTSPKALAN